MKLLATAAAALAAFTIATPTQAQAAPAPDFAAAKAIVQKLVEIGVTIATPTMCPSHMYGRYDYSTATLTLCPEALNDSALAVETVAHEAIHAAQHCVGGPLVKTVSPNAVSDYGDNIATAIGNKSTHVIESTKHLDLEERLSEYEAYAFESNPAVVLSILNKVCR